MKSQQKFILSCVNHQPFIHAKLNDQLILHYNLQHFVVAPSNINFHKNRGENIGTDINGGRLK